MLSTSFLKLGLNSRMGFADLAPPRGAPPCAALALSNIPRAIFHPHEPAIKPATTALCVLQTQMHSPSSPRACMRSPFVDRTAPAQTRAVESAPL